MEENLESKWLNGLGPIRPLLEIILATPNIEEIRIEKARVEEKVQGGGMIVLGEEMIVLGGDMIVRGGIAQEGEEVQEETVDLDHNYFILLSYRRYGQTNLPHQSSKFCNFYMLDILSEEMALVKRVCIRRNLNVDFFNSFTKLSVNLL